MSEDKWIVRTEKNQAPAVGGDREETKTMVYGGWQTAAKGSWPARVDGWTIVFSIDQETLTSVCGRLVFPERAAFEFAGNLRAMTRALEKVQGARAAFAIDEFTFVRD